MPTPVADWEDPRLAPYRNLSDEDLRGEHGLCMVESLPLVQRLLEAPEQVASVLLERRRYPELQDALGGLPAAVPVYTVERSLLRRLAGFPWHRGVLAAGRRVPGSFDQVIAPLVARPRLRLVLLQGVMKHTVLGAVFRTAAAFGVDGLVLDPTCGDPLFRHGIRASGGHVFRLPFVRSADWLHDLGKLRAMGLELLALHEGGIPLGALPARPRLGLVCGAPGPGLDGPTLASCSDAVAVPQPAGGPALEPAVGLAMALYAWGPGRDGSPRGP